jgi:hypothetical protein
VPEIFISYSAKDAAKARKLHSVLCIAGINTFLAEISLKPGAKWKNAILLNLRQSKWFLFLATRDSCQSDAVNTKLGLRLR